MHRSSKVLQTHIVEKGLTVGMYKGVHHAKRNMMKGGLPVDLVNTVLSEERNKKIVTEK